jgi:superfamily II DNA or RNA helicase
MVFSATSSVLQVTVPACFSRVIVVDANRARQLLVPSQVARLELGNPAIDTPAIRLLCGDTYRVVQRQPRDNEPRPALLIPKSVDFARTADLRDLPTVRWTGNLAPSVPSEVLDTLRGSFSFVEDQPAAGNRGLRTPQIGALHAVLGFWTTDPKDPGTVVMPTGTGKTETMVALFARRCVERLLVIVPSDALRTQIAAKFESFGLLQEFGVIGVKAKRPVVGQIRHGFTDNAAAISFSTSCNVVVATPNALRSTSPPVLAAFLATFSHLFVDEAHHVAAASWRSIRDAFADRPVLQFTATPFREDGRHLGGKIVYAFPLREAQRQRYFSTIDYVSVVDFGDPDRAIASNAVDRLRKDLAAGFDHLLMARANRIGRASELIPLYRQIAPDLNPVVIHSNSPVAERREALSAIAQRTSRIAICVDMLGEGFDLPALKIAAIHDAHKSLGVTLQFVGRFARSTATLGGATVVVARPELDFDDRLRRLYREDADWNLIVRILSESSVGNELETSEFEEGFGSPPDAVSIRNLLPKMSTVAFRTDSTDWNPTAVVDLFGEDRLLTFPIAINERERVAWFVTQDRTRVTWGDVPGLEEVTHDLYIVYWDQRRAIGYINSSNKDSHHEALAKCVLGAGASLLVGENVYRVMAQINRLVPTNVGVLDVRNRARRFSMFVGADVTEGFPVAEAQTKTKTNIFAYGFEGGQRTSVGASLKGRVWSYRVARSIKHWVEWCDGIGAKLLDSSISVDAIIDSFIRPVALEDRPALVVLAAEWPWEAFQSTTEETRVQVGDSAWPLVDVDIQITSRKTAGPITFDFVSPAWQVSCEARFNRGAVTYLPEANDAVVMNRNQSMPLDRYLNRCGLTFFLEKDAMIVHPGMLLQPNRDLPAFDPAGIEILDWTGVNIRKESQGSQRDASSVQARTIEHVLAQRDWDVVVDDDGPGEIADVVAIKISDEELHVTLVHCKYSSDELPGGRIHDLYEVCGQAQKSVRWRRNTELMLRQLIRRERNRSKRGGSGLMRGHGTRLYSIQDEARMLRPHFTIAIAQPGLSKSLVSDAQLELLASTQVYLRETSLADFTVFASS